jgi:hypothetical protein
VAGGGFRLPGGLLVPMIGPVGDRTGLLAAFCVVANVAQETASGEGGLEVRAGVRHFAAGAKVWVLPSGLAVDEPSLLRAAPGRCPPSTLIARRLGTMGVQVGSMGVQVGFAARLRKLPWLRSRATSDSSTHSCRSTDRRAGQESQASYRSISSL